MASLLLSVSCANPATTSPANPESVPTQPPTAVTVPGLPGQPPTGREKVYSVEIDLVPSKTIYLPGETVQMALTLTNASMGEVEPVYVSPLPPGINIVIPNDSAGTAKPGTREYYEKITGSRIVKTLAAGTGEKKLAAGEKVTYDLTWDQKDEDGNQAAPGWYFYESNINVRMESSDDSFGSGVRERAFLIQYPQGAMEKVIELNQFVTAVSLPLEVDGATKQGDITFTLKRVDLSQERSSFLILVSSPDSPLSNYKYGWANIDMDARYDVDGVTKELSAEKRQFTNEGMEMMFGYGNSYLDPVPDDARELTFTITRLGDWQGPWEFKVALE